MNRLFGRLNADVDFHEVSLLTDPVGLFECSEDPGHCGSIIMPAKYELQRFVHCYSYNLHYKFIIKS